MRIFEIYFAVIDASTGDIIAKCYGSYADPNIPANKDFSPQARVEALNMEQIKKQYGFSVPP
jgi:hypothetical protein